MAITMTTTSVNNKTNEGVELLKKQLRTAQLCQDWKAVERIERKLFELSSQQ